MAIDDQLAVLLAQNAELFAAYEEWANGQIMLLAGTVDDPNSFNEAGGKTGALGYYPVVNVSGQTIYVACVARLKAIALGGANAAVLEGLVGQVGGKLAAADAAIASTAAVRDQTVAEGSNARVQADRAKAQADAIGDITAKVATATQAAASAGASAARVRGAPYAVAANERGDLTPLLDRAPDGSFTTTGYSDWAQGHEVGIHLAAGDPIDAVQSWVQLGSDAATVIVRLWSRPAADTGQSATGPGWQPNDVLLTTATSTPAALGLTVGAPDLEFLNKPLDTSFTATADTVYFTEIDVRNAAGSRASYGIGVIALTSGYSQRAAGYHRATVDATAWSNVAATRPLAMMLARKAYVVTSSVKTDTDAGYALAMAAADKVGSAVYVPTFVGNALGGANGGAAARIHIDKSSPFPIDAPLTAFNMTATRGGRGYICLMSVVDATNYKLEQIYPVNCRKGDNTFLPGSGLPSNARVKAGWVRGWFAPFTGAQIGRVTSGGAHAETVTLAGVPVAGTTFTVASGAVILSISATYGVMADPLSPRVGSAEAKIATLQGAFTASDAAIGQSPDIGVLGSFGASAFGLLPDVDVASGVTISKVAWPRISLPTTAAFVTMRHYVRPIGNDLAALPGQGTDTLIQTVSFTPAQLGLVADGVTTKTILFPLIFPYAVATAGAPYFTLEAFNASNVPVGVRSGTANPLPAQLSRGYFKSSPTGTWNLAPSAVGLAYIVYATSLTAGAPVAAASRDQIATCAATVNGLTVTIDGGKSSLNRQGSPIPFAGSITLTASTTGSIANEARTLRYTGTTTFPDDATNVTHLDRANVSSVVVKEAGTPLVLATDYVLNSEHGGVYRATAGADRPVTVDYNYALRKYATIYLDPETKALAAVYGAERIRDAQEFLPKLPTKALPLFNARITGTTVELIPLWKTYAGGNRDLASQATVDIRRNRAALSRTRAKLIRGQPSRWAIYSDSILAQQSNSPVVAAKNGANRDRASSTPNGYYALNQGISSDVYAALPLFTALQNGWADDGAGAVHTRSSYAWYAVIDIAAAYGLTIGTDIILDNWGVAGTSLRSTANQALDPTRLNAFLAGGHTLAILAFGMNDLTNAANEADMATLVDACLAAGMEVIICGVPRTNLQYAGRTLDQWLTVNRALRRVAENKGVAFADFVAMSATENQGVMGISGNDMCAADEKNHPGPYEHRMMRLPLVQALVA